MALRLRQAKVRPLPLAALPPIISFIHNVTQFQGDGTFKRVAGSFDEYEITIWHHASRQSACQSRFIILSSDIVLALTVARIYFDRKDKITYKCIFDGLQDLVLNLTGRPLRFQALHPEGNLLTFGSDMELAELQAGGYHEACLTDMSYSLPAVTFLFFLFALLTD